MKQAPRFKLTDEQAVMYGKYNSYELLVMALKMLDQAALQQRGKKAFLHNNMTLEVIRNHVK